MAKRDYLQEAITLSPKIIRAIANMGEKGIDLADAIIWNVIPHGNIPMVVLDPGNKPYYEIERIKKVRFNSYDFYI